MEDVEKILLGAGVKPTANRILLMRAIISCAHTFTLADMEERLDSMDKSSIFRALNTLLEHKLIHEVDNGSHALLYCRCVCEQGHEHQHIHFTCSSCGKTFCIRNIDASALPRPEGFLVEEVNCVMKGICPDCLKKERS